MSKTRPKSKPPNPAYAAELFGDKGSLALPPASRRFLILTVYGRPPRPDEHRHSRTPPSRRYARCALRNASSSARPR